MMKAVGTVSSRMAVTEPTNRTMPEVGHDGVVGQIRHERDGPQGDAEEQQQGRCRKQEEERQDDLAGERQAAPGPRESVHLSTPPMIGSRLAMMAIVSATRWPGVSSPTVCRLKYDGSWMRRRKGWSEPSLMA